MVSCFIRDFFIQLARRKPEPALIHSSKFGYLILEALVWMSPFAAINQPPQHDDELRLKLQMFRGFVRVLASNPATICSLMLQRRASVEFLLPAPIIQDSGFCRLHPLIWLSRHCEQFHYTSPRIAGFNRFWNSGGVLLCL